MIVLPAPNPVWREQRDKAKHPRDIAQSAEPAFGQPAPRGLMRDGDRENERAFGSRHRREREEDAGKRKINLDADQRGRTRIRFIFLCASVCFCGGIRILCQSN